jgi:N utilization substance protein B
MYKRRDSREQAFTIIFENMFNHESVKDITEMAHEVRGEYIRDYAKELAEHAISNLEQIDNLIQLYSIKWSIDRISKVAVAILRMAIAEVLFVENVPESVSVDEAIELSKKYVDKGESGFIHGVLGAVVDNRKLSSSESTEQQN